MRMTNNKRVEVPPVQRLLAQVFVASVQLDFDADPDIVDTSIVLYSLIGKTGRLYMERSISFIASLSLTAHLPHILILTY